MEALKPLVTLLTRHEDFLKSAFARHHAFTHDEIHRHSGWLDFRLLSANTDVQWSETLIEEFVDRWDWEDLTSTVVLLNDVLSPEFIDRYRDRWNECILGLAEHGLPADDLMPPAKEPSLAERLAPKLSPQERARYNDLNEGDWSAARIAVEADSIDFGLLTRNENVEWSVELLTAYEDRWDWYRLASNQCLWDRILKPHTAALREFLVAGNPFAPEQNKAALKAMPPHVQAGVERVLATFGPRSQILPA